VALLREWPPAVQDQEVVADTGINLFPTDYLLLLPHFSITILANLPTSVDLVPPGTGSGPAPGTGVKNKPYDYRVDFRIRYYF
jgi:hypothetical protein